MEAISDPNGTPTTDLKTEESNIETNNNEPELPKEETLESNTTSDGKDAKPVDTGVTVTESTLPFEPPVDETHINGSLDQNHSESKTEETEQTSSEEKPAKDEKPTNDQDVKTEGLTNGSTVSPKITRSKRNSKVAEEVTPSSTPSKQTPIQSPTSEQRLTRSRYGRLQKAKTQNPEMIAYDVKRRPSLKGNDTSNPSGEVSPVKANANSGNGHQEKDLNNSIDSTPKLRKSKRGMSGSPRESARKRQTNKLDSVIDQIKSNTNESEQNNKSSASKASKSRFSKETAPQKKCIELSGGPSSRIVDRNQLLTIPKQEGDYAVGDLIWVKVSGYPFWPCMVSVDPITGVYSKISGNSHKAGHIYHVQYFGPQALRGWTSVGQTFPFEGRQKFLQKLEEIKDNSPKTQSAKIAAKFAIKPSLKREWDLSVDEAEEASKLSREERVHSLTFEYKLTSKMNLRRKSDSSIESGLDSKRKKMNSSPEDIYDFDDEADTDVFNLSESTPGLMWRKRSVKGDFAVYVERHIENVEKEHPGAERQELEAMLQRRWDLLGDDLRALYTDRKSIPNKDFNPTPTSTPKTIATPKKSSSKSSSKQNSIKKLPKVESNDSNESDSEGNLVIAETPTRKTPNKRVSKSSNKIISSNEVTKSNLKSEPKEPNSSATISNKKTKATPKQSKKGVEKSSGVKENGIKDKSISQTCEQPLNNFGIDYLDEFASSEDTSSTSEPEATEAKSTPEAKFCVVCNESEATDLMSCSGVCFQMYHKKCIKYDGLINQFKCEECESGKHSCFVCKKLIDSEQKETEKCADIKCGKFYHLSCLEKGYPYKMNDDKDSFVCPLHFCLNCHIEAQNDKEFRPSRRRLVKCISCPTAYHLGDYCIAAGTLVVSQNYVICPDHRQQKKKDSHVNVNYCFSCLTGGQLICCESCPAAFHSGCLDYTFDPEMNFYCSDCIARKPLHYGDVVWVKLGPYRWWPGKISHPKSVPDNVMKLPHISGDFPVYFFGSHDYYWLHKGRVFHYMEGDNKVMAASSSKKGSKTLTKTFKLALEEAAEQFKIWQETQVAIRKAMVINKPPHYTHIKSNKAIGPKVQITISDESQRSICECKVNNELTCNDENCINRALMVECDPKLCRAGEQCQNQRFKKRQYVLSKPFKTENAGWGLRTLEDIKKGQFVIEYVGELIDEEECQRRLKSAADNNQTNFYFLTIDKDTIIDAGPKGNLARFMNHSCQPNCETQKWMVNGATRVGLFAVTDIPAGTELTFNYNLDCRGNEKTRCVCGQTNCSGFIGVRPNKTDDSQSKKTSSNGQQSAKKKKKKNEKKPSPVDSEDHCFSCGEGGDLIMCDRKGCPKSYHLECLKLEQIPKGKWECPRHFCDVCGKSATALCSYCPNSVCRTHADPSKLTQLPDGGLMCSEHSDQEINGDISDLNETDAIDNAENVRKEEDISVAELQTNESSISFDTSGQSLTADEKSVTDL